VRDLQAFSTDKLLIENNISPLGEHMSPIVETFTPPNTPKPIGPYSHIAKVESFITISGAAIGQSVGQVSRENCVPNHE